MKELVGDQRGLVTVIFTTESLPYFVELMNVGAQAQGFNAVFDLEEFAPGKANIMWATLGEPEEDEVEADEEE